MEYFTLNNGVKMPVLGLGTCMPTKEQAERAVSVALEVGYRSIDTANVYYNEKVVGGAIKSSSVKREDIFLTSKIWPRQYKNAGDAIDATLERLDTPYLDLLLLHRPYGDTLRGWEALEAAVASGKARAIGLSNFTLKQAQKVMDSASVMPAVIQSECHPYMTVESVRKAYADKGVRFESWFPLGHGDKGLLGESVLRSIGEKYAKTPAQVVLRWHIDSGSIVIPGASSEAHLKENFDIFDFSLTREELDSISALDRGKGFFKMPDIIGRLTYRFISNKY